MNIGEKIGIYTKQAGISIRQLALKAELNYNTLYAFVKRGGKKLPDNQITKIARVLGISENALISGEIEDVPSEAEILLDTTIKVSSSVVDYFKEEAVDSGIPYQTLINLYLVDCVKTKKKLNISWK